MPNKDNRTKALPPTYFLIAILLMIALKFLLPEMQLFSAWWGLLGLVSIIAGIMANLFADGMFKRVETTVHPFEESSTLVTTGVYKHYAQSDVSGHGSNSSGDYALAK